MNNKIESLRPLGRFLMTIGELPTSYLMSMTYEEQLLWLCNYLEKTIIPKINEDTQAINELKTFTEELKKYVDDYFDSLDIQSEVDRVIERMVQTGELQEIILEILNTNSILGYNIVADMKNADNLINGNFCKTLGKNNYLDGLGEFYKIRTKLPTDVPDEDNLVELNNHPDLIAEKIPNATIRLILTSIENINNEIENINNDISEIENDVIKLKKPTKLIVIGDSWSDPIWGGIWQNIVGNDLNLTIKNYAVGGYGFVYNGTGLISSEVDTFLNENIPENEIHSIIVLGGLNDYSHGITIENLVPAIKNVLDNLRSSYPNTKILYVSNCMIPYNKAQLQYWNFIHNNNVLCNYTSLNLINKIEYYLWENETHLTENGQKWLSKQILTCLTGGELHPYSDIRNFSNNKVEVLYSTIPLTDESVLISARIKFLQNVNADTYETIPATNVNYGGEVPINGVIGADFISIIYRPTINSIIVGVNKNVLAGDTFIIDTVLRYDY